MSRTEKGLVVYWNTIPSPYVVDRLNALAAHDELRFEVWFNERTEADRSWDVDESSWKFSYRYLPKISLLGYSFNLPLYMFLSRPSAIVMGFGKVSFIFGFLCARIMNIPVGFRVVRVFESWGTAHPFTQWIRRRMFRMIFAVETHGRDGAAYARMMGASKARIFIVPQTVNPVIYCSDKKSQKVQAQVLRKKLSLKGITFIYVGRLWWGKSLDTLLRAFAIVQNRAEDPVSLLLIGDGPEEDKLKRLACEMGLQNFVIAGFVQQVNLPPYYRASHVFVFPTLGDPYGIVVDEAMTCGLPVISTTQAGEIHARVEDGVTGFLVPPKDMNALAEKMLIFVNNPNLIKKMGKVAKKRVRGHTPENWAKGMIDLYDYLLRQKK